MSVEERLSRIEKLVEQLWCACSEFKVEVDSCELGCCVDYAEIDIPRWSSNLLTNLDQQEADLNQ